MSLRGSASSKVLLGRMDNGDSCGSQKSRPKQRSTPTPLDIQQAPFREQPLRLPQIGQVSGHGPRCDEEAFAAGDAMTPGAPASVTAARQTSSETIATMTPTPMAGGHRRAHRHKTGSSATSTSALSPPGPLAVRASSKHCLLDRSNRSPMEHAKSDKSVTSERTDWSDKSPTPTSIRHCHRRHTCSALSLPQPRPVSAVEEDDDRESCAGSEAAPSSLAAPQYVSHRAVGKRRTWDANPHRRGYTDEATPTPGASPEASPSPEPLSPRSAPSPHPLLGHGGMGRVAQGAYGHGDDAPPTLPTVQGMNWRRGPAIGSGSDGAVYKAFDAEQGLIFAVKRAVFDEATDEDRSFRDNLRAELNILQGLRHRNIVSCLGNHVQDNTLYIFLEYAPGGSIASILREFGRLHDPLLQVASRGLLEGLNYLHEQHIIHRDIKGANILVDLSFCVKLADFGRSKAASASNTKTLSMVGSVPWMAPEVIQQQEGHGRSADVWSVGCTVIEMLTAQKPWGNKTFNNLMFALNHISNTDRLPPIPDEATQACRQLIEACVVRNPRDRTPVKELLGFDYVRDVLPTAGPMDPPFWQCAQERPHGGAVTAWH